MKKASFAAVFALAVGSFVTSASAAVITFESLAGGPAQAFFTAPIDGFNFGNNNAQTNDWLYNAPPGTNYPSPPGSQLVAVGYFPLVLPANIDAVESTPVTAVGGGDFTLQGAWFSGFSTDSIGAAALIYFNLYNNNVLVGTSNVASPNTTSPTFLSTGAFTGTPIDAFTVVGPAGFFLMDDVIVNAVPIPEPATYALMLLGIAGVGAAVRRKLAV